MILRQELLQAFQRGIQALYGVDISLDKLPLQPTRPGFSGTHTLVLFGLAPSVQKAPAPIGHELGRWLISNTDYIAHYEVVGGFLNLSLTDKAWLQQLAKASKESLQVAHRERIIIEIACPNTNKPLHLGHLRNSFLGDAIANILQAVGHDVKKIMHVNDRGIHICKSMFAYQQDPTPKTPQTSGIKGDHLVGEYYVRFEQNYKQEVAQLTKDLGDPEIAKKQAPSMLALQKMLQDWEAGEPATIALWKKMNHWVYDGFDATYTQLGITFDKVYYESELYLRGKEIVLEGLKKGIFYREADQSIWVNLEKEQLGQKLLLRSDSTAVYMTQDLGTADAREEDFHPDRSIYVVGNEQVYHFAALFTILKKLQRPYASCLEHIDYGMVTLPSGRMKSREGTVVDADDLISQMIEIAAQETKKLGKIDTLSSKEAKALYHMLGMGALKFFLLKVNPKQEMCFNPGESIALNGHTGPFIQYTHARIYSVLQKAKASAMSCPTTLPKDLTKGLEKSEKELIDLLIALRSKVHAAATKYNPAIVAQHLYTLAKTYNHFYALLPILKAKSPTIRSRRLYFSSLTMQHLRILAGYLGLRLPKRM